MSKKQNDKHPIITVEQAREQGMSGGIIRVIANGLDRRADVYHGYADTVDNKTDEYELRRQATINRANAIELRRMSRGV